MRRISLSVVALVAVCAPARVHGAGQDVDVQRRVDELIRGLSSTDEKQRLKAAVSLVEMGPAAIPALEKHLTARGPVTDRIIAVGRLLEAINGPGGGTIPHVEMELGQFAGPAATNQFGGKDQNTLDLVIVLHPLLSDPQAVKTQLEERRAKLRHIVSSEFTSSMSTDALSKLKVKDLCDEIRKGLNQELKPFAGVDVIAEVLVRDVRR